MMTDNGLADLFERAVRDLDPAVHAIVGRAEQRGRRLRKRRRLWTVLTGGLVVAALAGTAVAAGVPWVQPRAVRVAMGANRGHVSTTPKRVSHRPGRSGASHRTGRSGISHPPEQPMTLRQMLRLLRSLLPAGSTVSNVNPYSWKDKMLEVDYNDGHGAVDMLLTVWPTTQFMAPLACPKPLWQDEGPRPAGALPISCVMRTLPDGSIERDAVSYADAYSFYGYMVDDQRPDGASVSIQVNNGINHTLPQVDRARPPGSMAEWEALVENPAWRLMMAPS